LVRFAPNGIGIIIVTSISKIKKMTVIIKNRKEKGVRILWDGSNPHSNDLNFSYFIFIFCGLRRVEIDKRMIVTIRTKKINEESMVVRYSFMNFLIGN